MSFIKDIWFVIGIVLLVVGSIRGLIAVANQTEVQNKGWWILLGIVGSCIIIYQRLLLRLDLPFRGSFLYVSMLAGIVALFILFWFIGHYNGEEERAKENKKKAKKDKKTTKKNKKKAKKKKKKANKG